MDHHQGMNELGHKIKQQAWCGHAHHELLGSLRVVGADEVLLQRL